MTGKSNIIKDSNKLPDITIPANKPDGCEYNLIVTFSSEIQLECSFTIIPIAGDAVKLKIKTSMNGDGDGIVSIMNSCSEDFHSKILGVEKVDEYGNTVPWDRNETMPHLRLLYSDESV